MPRKREALAAAYRGVRQQIRRHDRSALVEFLVETLRVSEQPRRHPKAYKQYPPWLLLLLIKWTLREGKVRPRRPPHMDDVRDLVDMMKELDNRGPGLPDHDDLHLSLRRYYLQQIPFQEELSHRRFARQVLLFGGLDVSDRLRLLFREQTGVDIREHIKLSLTLLAAVAERKRALVSAQWFGGLASPLAALAPAFLDRLAKTERGAAAWLLECDADPTDVYYEYYGPSALSAFPLMKAGDQYRPYSVTLLEESLANCIYDTLRNANRDLFMQRFGKLFEAYVGMAIDRSGLAHAHETDMPRGPGEKVVDFVVRDADVSIFIDAKGVELAVAGLLSQRGYMVEGKLKTSVISAIRQAQQTAKRVLKSRGVGEVELGPGPNYLLVVTFKEFYISSGRDLARVIGQDRADELLSDGDGPPPIPLENMYFIPVDDFDCLMSLAQQGQSIGATLRDAVAADGAPSTRNALFRMHLGQVDAPDHMEEAYSRIWDDVEQELVC